MLNLVVDKTRCDEVTRCRAPEQRPENKRGIAIRSEVMLGVKRVQSSSPEFACCPTGTSNGSNLLLYGVICEATGRLEAKCAPIESVVRRKSKRRE